jgi:hypothetical protein
MSSHCVGNIYGALYLEEFASCVHEGSVQVQVCTSSGDKKTVDGVEDLPYNAKAQVSYLS